MLRLIILALSSLALAAQAPNPSAANEPKPGRIEGRVANAMTNEPVRKATVTLIAAPQPGQQGPQPGQNRAQAGQLAMPQFGGGAGSRLAVTTDAEGKFTFENVSPGQYRLSAEKAGFVRENSGLAGGMGLGPMAGGMGGRAMASLGIGASYKVTEGGSTSGVLLKLLPQGIASGKILDEDGEPFGQVRVTISEWNYAGATARFQPVGAAETDELGNFRIANLPPGRYYLSAEKSGGLSNGRARGAMRQAATSAPLVSGEETYSYARTYYPGVEELEQAQRIDIQAGQEMSGISLALRKRRVYLVSGELSGLNPEGRYMVQLSKSGGAGQSLPELLMGGGMGSMARVQGGRFTAANVLPGQYTIRVNEVGNRRPRLIARGEVAVSNADVLNAAVASVSPASIQGRVTIEGQNTLPQDIQGVRLEYRPLDGGMGFGMQPMQINADGSFALNDISPERYALNLAAERLNLFVKSITFNGVDIRASGLDLRSGGTGQVSIVLSPKVASLNGRVQLADGAEPGTILAYQQPYDPKGPISKILRASVQSDGSFTISNLAPGAYKLFAVEEVNSKLMNDPEWQAAQASEAVTVELGESATKSVSIRQIRR